MLDGSGRTSEPAVIRDGDQQLRTGGCEPAHFTRENRLVTNEGAEAASRNLAHAIRRPRREIGNIGGQASRESEPPAQRHVLAEGHEMNLIIGINSPAGRVQKHGAVGSEPGFIRGLFPIHDADQEIRSRIARDANCTRGKSRILPVERRGNFGPDDPLRRAGIFLGCSNADACELIQFAGVELQPVGWILLRLGKIRLDQVRDVVRRRGRDQIAAAKRHNEQHNRGDDDRAPRALCANQDGECYERAVRGDKKRKPVNSGDRSYLQQRETFDRRVTGKVPGKTDIGQMGAGEFQGDPEERRQHASLGRALS